jgi:hypothetical protein
MTQLYRGKIAYDDDEVDNYKPKTNHEKYRDPVRRREWYKMYRKTEKYLAYQRAYQKLYWQRKKLCGVGE